MDIFIRAVAGVLLAVILNIALHHKGSEISVLLSLAVCVMVAALSMRFLEPVISMLRALQVRSSIDSEMLSILLKTVGVGLIAELVSLICTDAGNAAMGKMIQILGAALVLNLSLPLLEILVDLVEGIVGNI